MWVIVASHAQRLTVNVSAFYLVTQDDTNIK